MNIVERFLNYTKINTTTNRENGAKGIMPSSSGQMELAKFLKSELEQLGLVDIKLFNTATLTATLPANTTKNIPTVAFFGHLDTSAEQTADTKAQIIDYQGGNICLNKQKNIYIKLSEFSELEQYKGQKIITTDGTSLLGADDKAAIAAIINAVQMLKNNSEIEHGPVKIAFVPDEKQGLLEAKAFDVKSFNANFAYTLNCGGIGEIVYENWNAGNAEITFKGESAHPMSAKGKLKNSLLMANKFIAMLPPSEAPEYTEGTEGYYWVKGLDGNSAKTILKMDIRDFTKEGYKSRMNFLKTLVNNMVKIWGENRVSIALWDRYENTFNNLEGDARYPVDIALEAYQRINIKPNPIPMRGGYDGAVLSQKGLPCPNLFTGAHNFHSIYEYLPVESLKAASNVVLEIIKITSKKF